MLNRYRDGHRDTTNESSSCANPFCPFRKQRLDVSLSSCLLADTHAADTRSAREEALLVWIHETRRFRGAEDTLDHVSGSHAESSRESGAPVIHHSKRTGDADTARQTLGPPFSLFSPLRLQKSSFKCLAFQIEHRGWFNSSNLKILEHLFRLNRQRGFIEWHHFYFYLSL